MVSLVVENISPLRADGQDVLVNPSNYGVVVPLIDAKPYLAWLIEVGEMR